MSDTRTLPTTDEMIEQATPAFQEWMACLKQSLDIDGTAELLMLCEIHQNLAYEAYLGGYVAGFVDASED